MSDDIGEHRMVSWSTVEEYDFSKIPVVQMVGETEFNEETKRKHIPRFHLIKPNGVLACDCFVEPSDHVVWPVNNIEPRFRWTICNKSKRYLRVLVTRELAKKK